MFSIPFYACQYGWMVCLNLFVFGILPSVSAQRAPHPSFRQYTTDDGLASPEVYHILQDKKDFIWIATDNGVSRFNGYEFHNYGFKEGLVENVIFMMQFDTLGRLWMQAMSGNLYYMEGDSIHPYWFNEVLENLQGRATLVGGFIVEGAGESVHIATFKYGIITISKNGTLVKHLQAKPSYSQVFEQKGQSIFGIYNYRKPTLLKSDQNKLSDTIRHFPVYFHVNDEVWSFPDQFYSRKEIHTPEAFFLDAGKYLFQMFDDVWYIEDGKNLWHCHFPYNIRYARLMQTGQLLLGLSNHHGLRAFESLQAFRESNGHAWLSGKTINFMMEDRVGGRWFATHEDGVFYAPVDAFSVYDAESGLPDEKVTALAIKKEGELFVGLENGNVWKLDYFSQRWEKLPEIPDAGAISALYFDQPTQQLWAGRDKLFYLTDTRWKLCAAPDPDYPFIYADKITGSPQNERLWVSAFRGFNSVALPQKLVSNDLVGLDLRTFAVREDFSGKIWVGQQKGLFQWENNTLQSCQNLHPAFSLRVEDIALLPDSSLAVATKGGGIVFWKNGKTEQITTSQGLTADMLECLWADEEGTLWAGTLNGLNRISGTWGQRKVNQITLFHGLPSNEISHICTKGEQGWIATNKGLVHFLNQTKKHAVPRPQVASVVANNQQLHASNILQLAAKQNNLTISFFAINYKMKGKILYRYRMNGGWWATTLSRSVNFPALSPGRRQFEVQAQNEDGTWSESARLQFEIMPPWYATWWAKALGLSMLFLATLGIYKYRTRQLKEAHQIQLRIADLERSALQAQMNPHFIFNCLNSIQNFILQNEKQSAILYLSSFATLVRSTLNASVAGKISLAEEVKLLDNYLSLEKLRFKDRFHYMIEVAPGVDAFEVKFPPLLVQPYVENAVLHGIAGRENGGRVEVFFKKKANLIEVNIRDNGKGISRDMNQQKSTHNHQSVGMSITLNRLKLLADEGMSNTVRVESLQNTNGEVEGTEVLIQIGLTENPDIYKY